MEQPDDGAGPKIGGSAASPLRYKSRSKISREHASPFRLEKSPEGRNATIHDVGPSTLCRPPASLLQRFTLKSATAPPPPPSSSAYDDPNASSSSFDANTTDVTVSTTVFTAVCSFDNLDGSAPTLSNARDFIMDRFLPAAHTIACDSPQPPTGRCQHLSSLSTFPRSRPLGSSLLSRPSPSPYHTQDRIATPALDDQLDANDDDDDDDDNSGPQSKKACGMFSFKCWSRSGLESKQAKETKKSPSTSRRRTLAEALREDAWDQEVNMAAPKPREHLSSTSGRSPLHLLFSLEEANSPNFYDAPSTFTHSASVSPYRNGPTTSPFLQSKMFLGMPGERSVHNMNQEADGSESLSEIPRASVGDDTNIVLSKNGYVYLSPFCSDQSKLDRPISKSHIQTRASSSNKAYSAERIAAEAGHRADSNPANASVLQPVIVDPVFQRSCHRENGAILSSETKAVPRFISNLVPKSFNSSFENKELQATDRSAGMLSPPLPKAPSESWLRKAKPLSKTNRSPIPDHHKSSMLQAKKLSSNNALKDAAKWEKLVKGCHIQAGHLRSSEVSLSNNRKLTGRSFGRGQAACRF